MTHLLTLARRITAGLTLSAAASLSAHAACPTTTSGWTRVVAGTDGSTLLFKVAVASNFVTAMQNLANSYLSYLGSSSTNYIEICGNSSGTIKTEINSYQSTDLFSVFFSADQGNTNGLSSSRGSSYQHLYANGIPVFLLSPNATSVDSGSYPALDYMTQGSSGATAQGTVSTISNKVIIDTNTADNYYISTLAIGDPSLAPYGAAAISILTAMGLPHNSSDYVNAGTDVSSTCASLIGSGSQWMCAYKNIDYTLQAINNNKVDAGIVSYGQVCSALNSSPPDSKRYVKFPDYPTTQYEISLNSTTAQQNSSDNFLSYLSITSPDASNGMGTTWNTWLQNNCYAKITSGS